jgi:hypothetical protein
MKREDIQPRQTHVVYILMGLAAAAGLLWALWEHTHAG